MFWWFKRDNDFMGYETREGTANVYELVVRLPDGSERVETFSDAAALHDRQVALTAELEGEGWSGPHGWHV